MPNRLSRLGDILEPKASDVLNQFALSVEGLLLDHYSEIGELDSLLAGRQSALTPDARGAFVDVLKNHLAPKPMSGTQLYRQAIDLIRVLPTGCDSLDALLGGGVREAQLTELAGESASGKTQTLMQLAALTALRGEGVVWIDTTNTFSPGRVLSMAASMAAGGSAYDEARHALACIMVLRAHTIHDVLHLMNQVALDLREALSGEGGRRGEGGANREIRILPEAAPKKVSLLIIDSISAVITPVLGGQTHNQGHVLMLSLARMVKSIAERYCLAAVVSNHVVGGGSTAVGGARPALGEHWRPQPSWRLLLSNVQGGQQVEGGGLIKRAERVTSPLHASGDCAFFVVTADGIMEAPLSAVASW